MQNQARSAGNQWLDLRHLSHVNVTIFWRVLLPFRCLHWFIIPLQHPTCRNAWSKQDNLRSGSQRSCLLRLCTGFAAQMCNRGWGYRNRKCVDRKVSGMPRGFVWLHLSIGAQIVLESTSLVRGSGTDPNTSAFFAA